MRRTRQKPQAGYGLLILAVLLISNTTWAQENRSERIRIENANTLRYTQKNGQKVRKLLGNVKFRQQGVRMSCDSAYQFQDDNRIKAYSNVYINQGDTLLLEGAFLRYNGNTRKAIITDSVRLRETTEQVILTTDTLHYNMAQNRAFYLSGGRIVDSANVLTSKRGYYRTAAKRFAFADSVELTNPDYTMNSDTLEYHTPTRKAYFHGPTTVTSDTNSLYCENGWYNTDKAIARLGTNTYVRSGDRELRTDSLYYNRNKPRGRAWGAIQLTDTARDLTLTGEEGLYQEQPHESFLTDSALARKDRKRDTFYLHGDTLRRNFDSAGQPILSAYHKARIFNRQFQAQADSMVYRPSDSMIHLIHHPVMWFENYQLTGRTMHIHTDGNGNIQRLVIRSEAFIISEERQPLFNQVKGRKVIAYFKDNALQRMDVKQKAEAIYYPTNKENQYIGINKIKSKAIRIFFTDEEIEAIHFLEKPDATIYPIGESNPEEFQFPGFAWLIDARPKQVADLFRSFKLRSTLNSAQ